MIPPPAPLPPIRHIAWVKGGHAQIVSIADDAIVLVSTTPAPPGARLEATLVADPSAVSLKIKSHGSRQGSDGTFTLRGRVLDAPRELRVRLAALVQAR